MRLRLKISWMWRKDVFEDMWAHGCLTGLIFVLTKGMPASLTTPLTLDKDTPAVDCYYLYIGLLFFYVRFIVEVKSKLHKLFLAPDLEDDETAEYNRKMHRVLNAMMIHEHRWRNVRSLAYDLQMSVSEVSELLEFLVRSGEVVRASYYGVKNKVKDEV